MVLESFSASAPGSLMLLGEYAVLHKHEAVMCAVNKRIRVNLSPRIDAIILIDSNEFGTFSTTIDKLNIVKPYEYILAVLISFYSQIKHGCTIQIVSDFSSQIGFGSSAAVTVATIGTLSRWLGIPLTLKAIHKQAKAIMLMVNRVGSGADLASSVYGGVLHYDSNTLSIRALPQIPKLTAVYSGSKYSTPHVIRIVEGARQQYPGLYEHIFQGILECVWQGVYAIKKCQWKQLGKLFSIQQSLLVALGVSMPLLEIMINQLEAFGALGAKISGSGLGDCVIGLGQMDQKYLLNAFNSWPKIQIITIQVSDVGLYYE